MLVAYPLVLTEHIADLSAANTYVASGDVGIGADVAIELGHKALAERHYLAIALALGVEIRTALAAADGQPGEAVL